MADNDNEQEIPAVAKKTRVLSEEEKERRRANLAKAREICIQKRREAALEKKETLDTAKRVIELEKKTAQKSLKDREAELLAEVTAEPAPKPAKGRPKKQPEPEPESETDTDSDSGTDVEDYKLELARLEKEKTKATRRGEKQAYAHAIAEKRREIDAMRAPAPSAHEQSLSRLYLQMFR
jgi:hypothetical protein